MGITAIQQRNRLMYNVLDFAGGLIPDGTNDFTNAILAAISAASGGGGTVFYPTGNYRAKNLPLYSNVGHFGAGINSTVIELVDNAGTDLFVGTVNGYVNGQNGYTGSTKLIDIGSPSGTGVTGGVNTFTFKDMSLDGNRGNQSSTSYVMRAYGYGYIFDNVDIRNGYSGGAILDWNGGSSIFQQGVAPISGTEGKWSNCQVHNNGGIGLQLGGPHDSQMSNCILFFNDSHNMLIGPNAPGVLGSNCHFFGPKTATNSVNLLVEAGYCQFSSSVAEGADCVQIALLASTFAWSGGHIYMAVVSSYASTAIQLGQVASATLKSAATSSPITLTTAPTTIAAACYLQFVITSASASGVISVSGVNFAGGSINETLSPSGNGTYTTTNAYAGTPTITYTGLTSASINVNGLALPYSGSTCQSAGVATAAIAAGSLIDTMISRCEGPNGAIWFVNDAGNNDVHINAYLTAGAYCSGTINPLTQFRFSPNNNLTPDGTVAKGGGVQHSINSINALRVTDRANDIFNVNTTNKKVSLANTSALYQYTDNYATEVLRLNNDANGTIYWHAADTNIQWRAAGVLKNSGAWCTGVSTSAAVIASSGTITTNSIGVARVAPTANVTSIIMQAGQINGQEVWVANESAFSITMAVSGTSNVSSGTLDVIGPNQGRIYKWDGGTNLWVPGGTQIYALSHLVTSGGSVPAVAALGSNGTSPPTPTSTGNDTRGNVQFGSGGSPATGSQISVTFANAYASAPIVVITANNGATALLTVYAASITTTGFNISAAVAPTASQSAGTYSVEYIVIG